MAQEEPSPGAGPLVVVRCSTCGNTFPVHDDGQGLLCPGCGGEDIDPAHEPLL